MFKFKAQNWDILKLLKINFIWRNSHAPGQVGEYNDIFLNEYNVQEQVLSLGRQAAGAFTP